jgi:hypothetical protein
VRFDFTGNPTSEEAAAIVAVLKVAFSNANAAPSVTEPSKWRAAARAAEDGSSNDLDLLLARKRRAPSSSPVG